MSEDKKPTPPVAEATPAKSKRFLILGGTLLFFLAAQTAVVWYFVQTLRPEDPAVVALRQQHEAEIEQKRQQTEMGTTLEAPIEVTVNIAGTEGERFLKAAVQLEFDPMYINLPVELNARLPKIRNIIIDILSSRPLAELMTVEGKMSIRNAIVADVNAILPDEVEGKEVGKIRRSFFDSFIIQ